MRFISISIRDSYASQTSSNFPVSALSILATSSGNYQDVVDATIMRANTVYREFLHSDVGAGFNGKVGLFVCLSVFSVCVFVVCVCVCLLL